MIVYPKKLFPDEPKFLSLADLMPFEFIDIGDSGPLGDLLWTRMMEEDTRLSSAFKVQTYFIAARLVAQEVGVCVIDKFTADGNISENMSYASFNPPLTFNVKVLHLENHSLSKVAEEFIPYF